LLRAVSAAAAPAASATERAPSEAEWALVLLFTGKSNRIHDGVGPLRRLDGAQERLLAAVIDAIGKNNQRLASLFLLDDVLRRQIDGVVEQRCSAGVTASAPAPAASRIAATLRVAAALGILLRVLVGWPNCG